MVDCIPFGGGWQSDPLEILDAASLLHEHGEVVELRALGKNERGYKETASGYYDDLEKLAADAASLDCGHRNVYATLNPVLSDLLARRMNRYEGGQVEATKDEHIVNRRWLPLDFDPVRPSGIASTTAEYEAAMELAARVAGEMSERHGWPAPIVANSGNGAHLLYAVDLPNDHESSELVQRVLNHCKAQFENEFVNIDTAVGNPSRIWRLYGTTNKKGENLTERPHCLSAIISVPKRRIVVPREALQAFAPAIDPLPRCTSSSRTNVALDVEQWLQDHAVEVRNHGPYQNGNGAVYRYQIHTCPLCGESDGSAVIVKMGSGALAYKCHHNRCAGKGWKDFRGAIEPACAIRQKLPQLILPGGAHTITDTASELGRLLAAQQSHFLRGGTVVCVAKDQSKDPILRPLKAVQLSSDAEAVARVVQVKIGKNGPDYSSAICNKATAELLLEADAFKRCLPPLKVLTRCPVLIEREGELVEVTGYDLGSGVLACGPPPLCISLDEAQQALNELLGGFRFASPGDQRVPLPALSLRRS